MKLNTTLSCHDGLKDLPKCKRAATWLYRLVLIHVMVVERAQGGDVFMTKAQYLILPSKAGNAGSTYRWRHRVQAYHFLQH